MSKGLTRIGDLLTGIIKPEMRPPSPVKQRLIDVPRTDEPDSTGSCKPVGVAAAANVGARNHKKEAHNAQQSLFDGMFELRENRLALTDNIVQIAQALIFCGMPYRPTTAREVVRKSRAADGTTITVVFKAMFDDVPLPYGSDRTLLHWMVDKAIKTKNPFVSWQRASEFLKQMEMSTGGRAFADLRKRYERLACMAITVHRSSAVDERFIMPVVRASRLPGSITPNTTKELDRTPGMLGVQLDEMFFREVLEHHVPMSETLLRVTDKKPQIQDYMMFLAWRSFAADAANRSAFIPWETLREQLWQEDSNPYRIRSRFKVAIASLKSAWPELQAEAKSKGLWIAPPKLGMHLLLGNSPSRRISPNASRTSS
jgi:hypothetical protein